jgi:hypothetical protein
MINAQENIIGNHYHREGQPNKKRMVTKKQRAENHLDKICPKQKTEIAPPLPLHRPQIPFVQQKQQSR